MNQKHCFTGKASALPNTIQFTTINGMKAPNFR